MTVRSGIPGCYGAGELRRCLPALFALFALASLGTDCGRRIPDQGTNAESADITTVAVAAVTRRPIFRQLTVSSELVPFQEIDVFAKEAGYVKDLLVDYGTRVRQGELMAVLEIPELQMLLVQDAAAIQAAEDEVTRAQHELDRVEADRHAAHLEYSRLKGVADTRAGLIAQQEVDNAHGRDLALEAEVQARRAALTATQSQLAVSKAKREHDRVLLDYSRITAPFAGVVTQRYANRGTLMQAGTNSSTQALPLVRLSQDQLFRLVIPVPESFVRYIRIGDAVQVRVPSLEKVFPGKIARVSRDVTRETRTMHTEVDVPNPLRILIPGLYAEATLVLGRNDNALAAPLQAVSRAGNQANAFVVDPRHVLRERQVTLGMENASYAEILSGLNQGELVVVSDRSGLKAGMPVRPREVVTPEYKAENLR